MRSNITQYFTYHYRNWCRILISSWTLKWHSIPCPDRWAFVCLAWIFWRKLTVWHHIVSGCDNCYEVRTACIIIGKYTNRQTDVFINNQPISRNHWDSDDTFFKSDFLKEHIFIFWWHLYVTSSNIDLLKIRSHFTKLWLKIKTFPFKELYFKISSAKCQPFFSRCQCVVNKQTGQTWGFPNQWQGTCQHLEDAIYSLYSHKENLKGHIWKMLFMAPTAI